MQKLVKGIHSFQKGFFASHSRLFEQLATGGQQPETLFISCSDSRVVPNLITSAGPGELFIVRNMGNVVPHPSLGGGTAAAIQYAVEVLHVESIVICGHTQCGAIAALLHPETVENLEFVKPWLAQADGVRRLIEDSYAHLDAEMRSTVAVQENVLAQLENLRSFSFVTERLEAGTLLISGWVFKISTGEVFAYDPELGEFTPLGA
jgi:carbonic anhydrase